MAAGSDNHHGSERASKDDVVERSTMLETTYNEVMTLVSRTADFVGAVKNGTAPGFDFGAGPAYTVESMRHTTRLMQVMAWLLTQRAVESGEMTAEEARDPKYRLGAPDICLARPVAGTDLLPRRFQEMITQSEQIYRRIKRIAEQMEAPTREHPVHNLMTRLGTDGVGELDSEDGWANENPDSEGPSGIKH